MIFLFSGLKLRQHWDEPVLGFTHLSKQDLSPEGSSTSLSAAGTKSIHNKSHTKMCHHSEWSRRKGIVSLLYSLLISHNSNILRIHCTIKEISAISNTNCDNKKLHHLNLLLSGLLLASNKKNFTPLPGSWRLFLCPDAASIPSTRSCPSN